MKTLLQSFKKTFFLTVLLAGISSMAFAATYTATSSGNWSSSSTWSGGTAPSLTNTGDLVVISTGVTVTMDNSVTMSSSNAQLEVMGTLSSTSNTLTNNAGTIYGAGTIAINSLVLGGGAFLTFTGTVTVNYFSSSVLSLDVLATVTVNKGMTLASGLLGFTNNGALSIANNSTITMAGGNLPLASGLPITWPSSYNVIYTATYASTGVELTGSGLQNVTMNSGSGNSVTLGSDLTVNDTFSMQSGTLVLNGHNLTINGDVAANGTGRISSTTASNISINSSTTNSGSLWFTNNASTVNNFTVNIADGGWPSLGSSMTVNGTLNLQKGTLYISNDTLQIAATGTISNASSSNYVVTNTNGFLSMYVTAANTTAMYYPIGTPSHFRPANMWLNTGSASGWVNVNAWDNVYEQGTTGPSVSQFQSSVNGTWDVQSNITTNMNLKMELMWNASEEVNGFDRTQAYISHFTNGSWDVSTTSSATLESNGMYGISRSNIQSLSPFAVYDDNTKAAVQPLDANSASNSGFEIYPNPAMSNIYIQDVTSTDKEMYAQILNVNGQIISTYIITDKTSAIDVSSFSKGIYFVKLYNNNTISTAKFVKL